MKQNKFTALFVDEFRVSQIFLSLSLTFGTWVIYIPQICQRLNLSEGQLGAAFLIGSIGSLCSVIFGKRLSQRYGEGKITFFASIACAGLMSSIFFAPNLAVFYILWACYGLAGGQLQIGLNSVTVIIENTSQKAIMSKCHGFYSLGGLISTGLGTLLVYLFRNPYLHMIFMAGISVGLQLYFRKQYIGIRSHGSSTPQTTESGSIQFRNLHLMGICFIALIVMVSEGAVADWSALFLNQVAATKLELVGLGYAGFSLAMTIFRFWGDQLRKKWSSWHIITGGLITSIVGFMIVLSRDPNFSIVGFFVVGSGFSIIVPELYRKAGNMEGVHPTQGIATIAGAGYLGFLAGPFLLGIVAEHMGLVTSFILLSLFVFLAFCISIVLQRKRPHEHKQLQACSE